MATPPAAKASGAVTSIKNCAVSLSRRSGSSWRRAVSQMTCTPRAAA